MSDKSIADNHEKKKIHPRAIDCLAISIAPLALMLCGCLIEEHFYSIIYLNKIIVIMLLPLACLAQPFGIALGIYALLGIRKDPHFSGKGLVITGFTFSVLTGVLILLDAFTIQF